jgi:hypothetical protein
MKKQDISKISEGRKNANEGCRNGPLTPNMVKRGSYSGPRCSAIVGGGDCLIHLQVPLYRQFLGHKNQDRGIKLAAEQVT